MFRKIHFLLLAASLLLLLPTAEARAWGALQSSMFAGAPPIGSVISAAGPGYGGYYGAPAYGAYYSAPTYGGYYRGGGYGGYYGGGFGAARAYGEGYRAGVYRGR